MFLRGDRSEYIGVGDEAIIKNHFPDVEIVTIANAGHWLHAENPKDFLMRLYLILFNLKIKILMNTIIKLLSKRYSCICIRQMCFRGVQVDGYLSAIIVALCYHC